eukprot:9690862-Alexandrium_andersonii.AAC.1
MSASLVGSEMCIRDRYCLRVRSCCVRPPGNGKPLAPGHEQWELQPCCTCLLYTSDAADDM